MGARRDAAEKEPLRVHTELLSLRPEPADAAPDHGDHLIERIPGSEPIVYGRERRACSHEVRGGERRALLGEFLPVAAVDEYMNGAAAGGGEEVQRFFGMRSVTQ